MPKLVPVSYRNLARKLKRAGYIEIRTSRHPVFYLAEKNLTIPVPRHPGDVPKGTLRAIIKEMGISIEDFNNL
ncbi:MAG TPA: type II toxin-antitoxin system HicA family toxin [Planctomycetota bacterium]|jgi:predicted RNA binding protein YcfA (HicA-like mRNA interferase family)